MTKVRLLYKNLWRNGTLLTYSSEHPQFPVEMTQDDITTLPWQSRHGTGSGNGEFVIGPTNKYIDFVDISNSVIVDGGMEAWLSATNLTNWTEVLAGTSTVNQEGSTQHSGTYCVRLDIDASNSGAYIYQTPTLVAGAQYRVKIWYKTTGGATATFQLYSTVAGIGLQSDGSWTAPGGYGTITLPASATWTMCSINFTNTTGATAFTFNLKRGTAISQSIYFDDIQINKIITATITPATYNAQTLCTEIKTQMDAAGGTYIVSYDELTGKFTISSSDDFAILWLYGANTANNAAGLLGYNKTSDDTEATSYTGDYITIHTSENLICDFGSALEYDFIGLLNHNLTAGATITIKGADDAAITTNVVSDTITYNGNDVFEFLAAARTKRYCQVLIADPTNPSCYVQIGTIIVGKYFQPLRSFGAYSEGPVDTSEIEFSPSKNMLVIQDQPKLSNWDLQFTGLDAASALQMKALLLECGITKAFALCTDYTTPNGNTYWVHLRETSLPECPQKDYWSWSAPIEEML